METDNDTHVPQGIMIDLIQRSPFQVRADEDEDLQSLADDMAANGLIQPVTVRKRTDFERFGQADFRGDVYELVAGHRRVAAARMLHWERIPAIVVEVDDNAAERMLVAENFARRDLTPLEMAETAAALVERHGAAEAGKICGRSERWAQRMAYIANRLTEDWRRVAQAWKFSQASLEAVARNCPASQAEILAGIMKKAKAADAAALAAMSGTVSINALDDGGDPRELATPDNYPSDSCWLKNAPWIACRLADCDGCQSRTDSMPLLDDEKPRFDLARCTDKSCFRAKEKEWMAWRGKKEWEKKLHQEVITLPKGVDSWLGYDKQDKQHTIPVMLPASNYHAGFVNWFNADVIHPPKKQPKKKTFPTDAEARDTAYCETVREWLSECDDIHALITLLIALDLNCQIDGKDVWGTVPRINAAHALEPAGIVTTLRQLAMTVTTGFLVLTRGRTGHSKDEVDAARAVADIVCGGDAKALAGLKAEADALGKQRIEAIAAAKKAKSVKRSGRI